MSRAERLKLRAYAAWLIVCMYADILKQIITSPNAVMRFAVGESVRERMERKIDSLVLSERDRKILKRRVFDGIKLEPLAEEFELSERTVRNICKKYEKIIA